MQDDCDDAQLSQGFSTYDTNCEDEYDMDPVQRKLKAQKLSEALAVLAIRPPSFNSLFTAGRLEQLKTLLERAVKERCDTYSDRQELLELGLPVPPPATMKASSKVGNQEEYAPFINEEADLPTIHEAYQYLNKVYVNDIIELKKKRKAAGLKMDALCAFGGMTPKASPNVQRRGSFKPQKSKEIIENDSDSEEDGKKLVNQIDGLLGNLGVADPLNDGQSRRGSRRNSWRAAADDLGVENAGGSRSRRGSFVPGDSLGIGAEDGKRSRRGSRVGGMDDDNNKKDKSRRPSRVPGGAIVDVTMANNAKNELSLANDKRNKNKRKSMRKKKNKNKKDKGEKDEDDGGD